MVSRGGGLSARAIRHYYVTPKCDLNGLRKLFAAKHRPQRASLRNSVRRPGVLERTEYKSSLRGESTALRVCMDLHSALQTRVTQSTCDMLLEPQAGFAVGKSTPVRQTWSEEHTWTLCDYNLEVYHVNHAHCARLLGSLIFPAAFQSIIWRDLYIRDFFKAILIK